MTKHVVFTLASSLTGSLFVEICSPVDTVLISKELKHWETDFQICCDIFVEFVPCMFPQ
jgi:hypothetical protein